MSQPLIETPQTIYLVATITEMKAYFGNANRIQVTDTNDEYVNCPSCTADETIVFQGVDTRKWQRITPPQKYADSVAALRTIPAPHGVTYAKTAGYYAPKDKGEAQYIWDSASTQTDDGGGYIKPNSVTGAGRWVLIPENGVLNILQFGAKAEWTGTGSARGFDNFQVITNALAFAFGGAVGQYNYGRYKVRIPATVGEHYYYISDTIKLHSGVEIFGDAGGWSYLMFQGGKAGFVIPYVNYPDAATPGTRLTYLHDFYMQSDGSILNKNNKHGITINATSRLERVHVQNFEGDGFHFEATAPDGNCNNSYIANCIAQGNAQNGFYASGADANNITFVMNDASGNSQFGFYDNSFLGNNYSGSHTAENGLWPSLGAKAMVFNNNKWYSAIVDNINKEPGVASDWKTYWQLESDEPGLTINLFHPQWNSSTQYIKGGSYMFANINQTGACFGCYLEGGQAPVYNNGANLIVGGTAPESQKTGGFIRGNTFGIQLASVATKLNADTTYFTAGRSTALGGDFGVANVTDGISIGFAYDPIRKRLVAQQNESPGRFFLTSTLTSGPDLGRTRAGVATEPGVVQGGFYFDQSDNTGTFSKLTFNRFKGDSIFGTAQEIGDLSFYTPTSADANSMLFAVRATSAFAGATTGTWLKLYALPKPLDQALSDLGYSPGGGGAGYAGGSATTNALFWNGSTFAPRNITGADVASGTVAPARIASGTATTGYVPTVQGDGSLAFAAAGGGGGLSGMTATRIQYATSASALGDDADLHWDATNKRLYSGENAFTSNSTTHNISISNPGIPATATGTFNIGIGRQTLGGLTTGSTNMAFGENVLAACTTGQSNAGIGVNALQGLTTGNYNTSIGYGSGGGITTGQYNNVIGALAGANITSGGQNFVVGFSVDAPSATASGQINLLNAIYATGATATGSAPTTSKVGIRKASPNYELDVAGTIAGTGTVKSAVAKTAAYTITATDDVIFADGTTTAFTTTLPTAVGRQGQQYQIVKVDSSANAITVATTSSQNIISPAGSTTTLSLATQGKYVKVMSDNAKWIVVSSN